MAVVAEPSERRAATNSQDAAVRLERVSKSFGGRKVLDSVSFEVANGSGFAILGRSGTGKSVMLRHIVGLMTPDAGRVYVYDDEVSALKGKELSRVRRGIGFLFQNAALFDSITVGENVAFPLRRHTRLDDTAIRSRARELLGQVGLGSEYDTMPADLSGGMRKRAGLARALALDPAILLADEPSAGLDPVTAAEIDALLVELKRRSNTTMVVVTHNIPSARAIADQFLFLHEGRVLERGSAEDLDRSRSPLVREFMRAQGAG